jgi:hypothetical protein
MWAGRAMVIMMPTEENSWLVHQSSLAILPAETSESEYEEWTKEWEFCESVAEIRQRIFNML